MTVNLDNNGYEIDEYVDEIKKNGFEISSINMTFDEVDNMKRWAMKDWASSWKGALPQEIKDTDGNLVEFTEENIEDVKAQLAMNTFNEMIDVTIGKRNTASIDAGMLPFNRGSGAGENHTSVPGLTPHPAIVDGAAPAPKRRNTSLMPGIITPAAIGDVPEQKSLDLSSDDSADMLDHATRAL